jgi:branched-subunit amino acid transport protein AzlD
MSLTELLFLIVTIAVITFLFRYTPFILPKNIIQNDFVINFGKKLPSGIMLILFFHHMYLMYIMMGRNTHIFFKMNE